MIQQLDKIGTIYDLLALCSSYILNELQYGSYKFELFNEDEYENVYNAVNRYVCEEDERGENAAFDELKDFLYDYLEAGITIERCYAVVYFIDDLVKGRIQRGLTGRYDIIKYDALNQQYKDKIRIIPKLRDTFVLQGDMHYRKETESEFSLFRKRGVCACSRLDEYIVNYIIWDEDKIKDYPMWIYRLEEEHPIAKHFFDREKIVFKIVPLTDMPLNKILDVKRQQRAFYIDKIYPDAEMVLKERYMDSVVKSENEDVDFLIYPEMLLTESMYKELSVQRSNKRPQVIVNGSVWKNNTNKSVVTDGNGKEIFAYLKKEPYIDKFEGREYRELLDHDKNKEFSVLEIAGLGRIGIAICKDLKNEYIKLFHKCIGTDMLIVPACTNSMDLKFSAEEMAGEYNCVVLVANTCSTHSSTGADRIGFISLPAKQETDRTTLTIEYGQNECVDQCKQTCSGKLLVLKFKQTERKDGKLSFSIKDVN